MNKEFLKMQKLAGLITESEFKEKLNEEIYKSNPYNELYKVTNLPTGDLQNPEVKNVINTIVSDAYPNSDFESFLNSEKWVEEVNSYLNRLSSTDVVYIHTDGEGRLSIYNTLENFSDGYKTEEEWGVESWVEI